MAQANKAMPFRGIKLNRTPDINTGALATRTVNSLPLRRADFACLADALDYAALGNTGANFYSGSGKLTAVLPYRALREKALVLARRLLSLPLERGARVAIVAETNPDFLRFFFACQYAGLVPVALPAAVNLGGHDAYVVRLRGLLLGCGASVAMASSQFQRFLREAAEGVDLAFVGTPAAFDELPEKNVSLRPSGPTETAYLQYTSGSTSFPRGVVIKQEAVLSNLYGVVNHSLDVRPDDRCVSWLPFYHDMGLVGCMLAPMATQRSIDYLDTRDFAMRPRRWLELMTSTRASISFSPPFGYDLCARRIRPEDVARYDLSAWRIAGIGAEPIRAELPDRFAKLLAPAGFNPRAFVPCYGMAESSLAISFSPLLQGVIVDWIDADFLAEHLRAVPAGPETSRVNGFVRCGAPLPGHEVAIRDDQGNALPDLHVGRIKVRGPSVMSGYFGQPEQTRQALSPEGWLDTGDIGYRVDGSVVVTGRHKDMIIINGRNIWPQDIEHIAERQPGLRPMDASAFFVLGPDDEEIAVVVVQCNISDAAECHLLTQRLHREIHEELGITCLIELVPRHTLPRTSSGKLSRAAAREDYLRRREEERKGARGDLDKTSYFEQRNPPAAIGR
jgi:fatty-acyl-CoA synthase